ncbi:MAG: hypothetical protein GTN93_10585 [Anaerolineae bacterium]|nr:hypothetical protein [Anaerolineae bacterium]NIQ78520.1 hypothetical protein [Anaerolineae bacterium]
MYGTIAKLKVKPGVIESLKHTMEGQERPPGSIAYYVYHMDSDPNELYVAVVFESREAYFANADSPEQHKRYEQMMEWLTTEPEWHDGEIIHYEQ